MEMDQEVEWNRLQQKNKQISEAGKERSKDGDWEIFFFFSHFRVDGLRKRHVQNSCSSMRSADEGWETKKSIKTSLFGRRKALAQHKSKASDESLEEEGPCWTEEYEGRKDGLQKRTVFFQSQSQVR